MRITTTCFKESGKYYAEKESEIPQMYTWELRDYILTHKETWPVVSLANFYTVVDVVDGVPIMIHPDKTAE